MKERSGSNNWVSKWLESQRWMATHGLWVWSKQGGWTRVSSIVESLRITSVIPYRTKFRRTKLPKIWLAAENFVRWNLKHVKLLSSILSPLGDPVAGKYGYPGFCDTNYLTLNTLFQHVVRNHNDIAYVLWTGDVPSHDVWNQTEAGQTSAIHQASAFLEKYFPHIKGITLAPLVFGRFNFRPSSINNIFSFLFNV